jgi:hypothetical protein
VPHVVAPSQKITDNCASAGSAFMSESGAVSVSAEVRHQQILVPLDPLRADQALEQGAIASTRRADRYGLPVSCARPRLRSSTINGRFV